MAIDSCQNAPTVHQHRSRATEALALVKEEEELAKMRGELEIWAAGQAAADRELDELRRRMDEALLGGGGGGGVRAAPQSAPVKVAPSARLQKLESIKADALSRFNRMSKSKAI